MKILANAAMVTLDQNQSEVDLNSILNSRLVMFLRIGDGFLTLDNWLIPQKIIKLEYLDVTENKNNYEYTHVKKKHLTEMPLSISCVWKMSVSSTTKKQQRVNVLQNT